MTIEKEKDLLIDIIRRYRKADIYRDLYGDWTANIISKEKFKKECEKIAEEYKVIESEEEVIEEILFVTDMINEELSSIDVAVILGYYPVDIDRIIRNNLNKIEQFRSKEIHSNGRVYPPEFFEEEVLKLKELKK